MPNPTTDQQKTNKERLYFLAPAMQWGARFDAQLEMGASVICRFLAKYDVVHRLHTMIKQIFGVYIKGLRSSTRGFRS